MSKNVEKESPKQKKSWLFFKSKSGDTQVPEQTTQMNQITSQETKKIVQESNIIQPNAFSSTVPVTLGSASNSSAQKMFQSPTSSVIEEPLKPKKKSTIKKALSTSIPILSWLRLSQSNQNSVNPILHLATAALNEREDPNETTSSIHQILTDAYVSPLWTPNDQVSSIESFNSNDEIGFKNTSSSDSTSELNLAPQINDLNISTEVKEQPLSIEEKLQRVFELPEKDVYVTEFACWFVHSVLIKGYMYLTKNHVCFYAEIPMSPGLVKKQGFLQKKSKRTKKSSKYWFVLKSDSLYIYSDAAKLYFPRSTIPLKDVTVCRPSSSKYGLKVKSAGKTYHFKADSDLQMREWIDAINSAVFKATHSTNDVYVVLPFSSIAGISIVPTEFNCDALKITAVCEEIIKPEEYYFSYFHDIENAIALLKECWGQAKGTKLIPRKPSRLLHQHSSGSSIAGKMSSSSSMPDVTHDLPPRLDKPPAIYVAESDSKLQDVRKSTSYNAPLSVPIFPSNPDLAFQEPDRRKSVDNTEKRRSWWSHRKSSSDGEGMMVQAEDFEKKEQMFKTYFAVEKTEKLIHATSAYLIKMIPLLGKIYISSNYICFKSVLVGPRAKVVLPIKDIFSFAKGKKYTRFYYGLIITTIDQEEIIFDFHSDEAREKALQILENIRSLPQINVQGTLEKSNSSLMEDIVHKEKHLKYTLSRDQLTVIQPLGMSNVEPPRKMHITCLTIGTRGDVQPYIALCKELMKDGHTCRIATHAEYQEWIESFGIQFSIVQGNPAELMQLCVDHGKINVGFLREAVSKFLGWIDDLLESCRLACEGTDLLIESPTAFGGIHVAEALGIPFFSAFPMPWSRTRSYPHPFGVSDRSMGGTYNYISYVLIEEVLYKAMLSIVNRWRKTKLNLRPLGITLEDKKVPFLYSFSPTVVPHPPDWPDWIHVCGYWFLDNPDVTWTPPESLTKFMAAGPPPVYIGFGSIIVPDPDELTRMIIAAVVKSGCRAILSKGWSARGKEGPETEFEFPSSIYTLNSVPHDWLFPQCAGVVHHGGAGSTAAGLRAGVPTAIRPFFGDQFFWAERVQDLGAGLFIRKFNVDQLTSALVQLTTDTKMKEKASLIGQKIRAENGVRNAINYIYRDLDFATERIKEIARMHKKSSL